MTAARPPLVLLAGGRAEDVAGAARERDHDAEVIGAVRAWAERMREAGYPLPDTPLGRAARDLLDALHDLEHHARPGA